MVNFSFEMLLGTRSAIFVAGQRICTGFDAQESQQYDRTMYMTTCNEHRSKSYEGRQNIQVESGGATCQIAIAKKFLILN